MRIPANQLVLCVVAVVSLACGVGEKKTSDSVAVSTKASQDIGGADTSDLEVVSVSDTAELQFPAGPEMRPINAGASGDAASPSSRKGAYTVIDAGGHTPCKAPNAETMALYDKYGARHICFTYFLEANSTWHTILTDAVYRAIGVVVPGLDQIELYQPNSNVVRFQVKQDKNYRLYTHWSHDLSNVPPPGGYTDHKFVNAMDRSVDYYMKIRKRPRRNTRIGGVAEVIFIPQELCEVARRELFLDGVGNSRPCPQPDGPLFR